MIFLALTEKKHKVCVRPTMNPDEFDGDVDVFDDGSSAVAGQTHLENVKEFVLQYDQQLRTLEHALNDSLCAPWDSECKKKNQNNIIE